MLNLVRLALRRPYTAAVSAVLILLMCGLSVSRMLVDIFPVIDIPVVEVAWSYGGLSAEDMERRVVFLAERNYSTSVNGIERIESESIPGVGPRTAEAVVAFLPEPQRFQSSKQVSAYGGFVPKQYQSSELDRRGRISKRGPKTLRKLLVECAWCLLRYNTWARAVYQRLTHGGKARKKQAIVALARKLLVRCWAMLRDGTVWRGDPLPPATAPT